MFSANTAPPASNDIAVVLPPEDSVSALEFSPATVPQTYLIAGSWDSQVRCWQVEQSGETIPKAMKILGGPVMDVSWSDDGSKVFMAGCDKQGKMWDLAADQVVQVAAHDAPVKTCHWIKAANYTCLMTGSWDKTLKFWDTRSSTPMLSINLPERCFCADVDYPMAVVGTAQRDVIVYSLENGPVEYSCRKAPLKGQNRCISIFKNKDKVPGGYALGSTQGRIAIQYVNPMNPRGNFIFKCHRRSGTEGCLDIYVVNDVACHPVHGTLASVGSDGTYSLLDKDARIKMKSSEAKDQPITKCCFNASGSILAYALGYDWSKGHEHYDASKKPQIFLRSCYEELKPRSQ